MRNFLLVAGLAAIAAPTVAQTAVAAPPAIEIPRELTDPAMADRLGKTVQGLTDALLDLKVGEVQAAIDGRKASPAEKELTVRDLERRRDPNFERDVRSQVAQAGPKITQAMKALSDALPAITRALNDASRAIDRAAANMPDPNYPRR